MFRRSIRALAIALGLLTALASPALAGGWAVATLDAAPAVFRAGQSHTIGFTIRQHGLTPVRAEQLGGEVAIRVRPAEGGPAIVFPARPEGLLGHYAADVRFPRAGGWSWEIVQGPFGPQSLGALTVEPAAAPTAAAAAPARAVAVAPAPGRPTPSIDLVLPIAALFGLAAAALALVALARRSDLAV
jgi:hypothetical protein